MWYMIMSHHSGNAIETVHVASFAQFIDEEFFYKLVEKNVNTNFNMDLKFFRGKMYMEIGLPANLLIEFFITTFLRQLI